MVKYRPPRLYTDSKGRYIKLNGKRINISSEMNNKQLVQIVLQNFQKRKRRNRKKLKNNVKSVDDLETLNKNSGSSNRLTTPTNNDLAKLLFFIQLNQKDKEAREKKDKDDQEKVRQVEIQPRQPQLLQYQQPPAIVDDGRVEVPFFGSTIRADPPSVKKMVQLNNAFGQTTQEYEALKKVNQENEQRQKKAQFELNLTKNRTILQRIGQSIQKKRGSHATKDVINLLLRDNIITPETITYWEDFLKENLKMNLHY